MASWVIDGVTINAEHVEFEDIKSGDEIISLQVPDDGSGDVNFWVGVVREFNSFANEWLGGFCYFGKGNDYTNEPIVFHNITHSVNGKNTVSIVSADRARDFSFSLYRVV